MCADEIIILSNIKMLAGIKTDEYDSILKIVVSGAVEEAKAFINRPELPKELEFVLSNMCIEYLKTGSYGIREFETTDIKSIQRGDTNISYMDTIRLTQPEIFEAYKMKLLPYRIIKSL